MKWLDPADCNKGFEYLYPLKQEPAIFLTTKMMSGKCEKHEYYICTSARNHTNEMIFKIVYMKSCVYLLLIPLKHFKAFHQTVDGFVLTNIIITFSWSVLLRIFMPAEDYEKLPAGTVEAHKVSEAGEERYVLDAIIGEATW